MAFDDGDKDTLSPMNFEDSNVSYMQYLEAQGGKMVDPLSREGLELQAAYLKYLNNDNHPIDVLRRISVNPWAQTKDRISAAKALLEYTARRVPATIELTGNDGKPLQIDASAMKNLSNADLDTLTKLLEKANKAK